MSSTGRIHGGTDASGSALHDFSTNSNACGPCPLALAAVQAADASRYPDANYTQLRQALADMHGVERWRVVLAGSASEFIFRLTACLQRSGHRQFFTAAQSYGDYAHAAQAWGLVRSQRVEEADLVWACEPSSPLGQAHRHWPAWLLNGSSLPAGRHTVVLDAAYAPLRLGGKASLNTAQCEQVWQLHSPNKALALTGVRAAYAIAPVHGRQLAQALDATAPSWPIGVHGEAMLLAWTNSEVQAWLRTCLPVLQSWKAAQVRMLQDMGWTCLAGDANFFCAQPPGHTDLAGLLLRLRLQGIKLRDATSLGLPGHVRLSTQSLQAQQALQGALVAEPAAGLAAAAPPVSASPPIFLETMQ